MRPRRRLTKQPGPLHEGFDISFYSLRNTVPDLPEFSPSDADMRDEATASSLTEDERDLYLADEYDAELDAADEAEDGVTFADLGLPDDILAAITDMGFVTPTPIQAEAIPALLDLRDVVGIAQTGTGKTAAFGLPLLALMDVDEKDVQALVLAPTRELAMQSAQAITDFAARTKNLDVVPVYGGSPYGPQISALKRGAQVVVGTPGRVIDLIEKGALDLSNVRMLVLDEADEMLRMGFAEDVETITASAPEDRLTALFSATMPAAIEKIAATHLNNPLKIAVSEESSTVDTIHQTYAVVPYKHKIGALSRVLATRAQHQASEDSDAAIVFVRTRMDVEEISLELSGRGFRAAGISGDVAQTERERMVERLRSGALDVLVATDVAARGLDVERIGLVVNFDVPREPEAYVHRIGRTGRAGREGRSLTRNRTHNGTGLHTILLTDLNAVAPASSRPCRATASRILSALRTAFLQTSPFERSAHELTGLVEFFFATDLALTATILLIPRLGAVISHGLGEQSSRDIRQIQIRRVVHLVEELVVQIQTPLGNTFPDGIQNATRAELRDGRG